MALRRKNNQEFKPDVTSATWYKTLRLTNLQKLRLMKWGTLSLTILMAVVLQDVILSQISIMGATGELAVCVILLITVMEGTQTGSLFVLIASVCYFYTGTAPGAYSIGLLCFLGIGVTMFRQMYLNRSRGSITMAAAVAAFVYEIGIFGFGLFEGLTRWDRLPVFVLSGAFNILLLIPLYPLIHKIGLIGGNTWKE